MLIAFTPTALCADAVTINALSNATAGNQVTISGTTSLSEVSIKVVNPDKTILFLDTVVPGGGKFSTTFTLPEDLATGAYTVTAGKASTTATVTLSVTALPPIQLTAPAKPALSGGIASWAAVANENNGYSLKLYKDGTLSGTVKVAHGAALSYNLSTAMTTGGSYTVTVTALGSGKYCDSEASPESDPQVVVIKVTGTSLNAIGINLLVGSSQTLTAAIIPAGASNQTVTWSSDNTSVATVDTNGKVTGIAAGSATITVTTADGGFKAACTVTVTSAGNDGGGSSISAGTYKANISGTGLTGTSMPISVNSNTGCAAADLSTLQGNIFTRGETMVVTMPAIASVDNYALEIPVSSLSGSQGEGSLTFATDRGRISIPDNMLKGISGTEGKLAEITIGKGDESGLPETVKAAIGDRPLIQLTMAIDGKKTEWSNPNAPITISIPYTPTTAELANPESIVIWYIDGSGNAVTIPNGRYDQATGMVTFETTHFSNYAVVYNKVSFNDVAADVWYNKAVSFIAARGITGGTGNGNYSPSTKLTRGDFLVLLMKSYGIAADANPTDNFTDAGNTYYTGYLAAAKRLGISSGVGNNMYAPDNETTRQEMFTLLYNALKVIGQLPEGSSSKTLSDFSDASDIASWAKDAMTLLIETGTVSGSDSKLSPAASATRAEMAQVWYSLLSK